MKIVFVALAAIAIVPAKADVIPQGPATHIFAEAHARCAADASALWGVSLCVPLLLVDPKTRHAATNVAAPGAVRDGGLFRLTLPAGVPISDTPAEYGGLHFAEVIWPPYGSPDTQVVTLMHESFHVVQPTLGFTGYAGTGSINGVAALDTQAGRVWLRGELHALRAALRRRGAARTRALRDALALRFYREALQRDTAEPERQLEIIEGLAESTGIDAGLPATRRLSYALFDLGFVEAQPSYARSFAYATGPAYSELLDAVRPGWRRSVTPSSDLAETAMRAYGLDVVAPSPSQAHTIVSRYGGAAIESEEAARAARNAARLKQYTHELVDGPTLTVPMAGMRITFNPRDIETFEPYGSVYHTLTVTAPWGEITVHGGDAVITKDFRFLAVAAPREIGGRPLRGDGWTLNLAAGYVVAPDARKHGSYVIQAGGRPWRARYSVRSATIGSTVMARRAGM